jgi:hypothetical protein
MDQNILQNHIFLTTIVGDCAPNPSDFCIHFDIQMFVINISFIH